jgi:hypothetical protein
MEIAMRNKRPELDVYSDEDGNVPKRIWISIYTITRQYGGPEEGGWWYNWYNHEFALSILNDKEQIAEAVSYLWEMAREEEWVEGDIYSVLGGQDISIRLEEHPGSGRSTERPYYC